MKFRDYYKIPQNRLAVPANALYDIEREAELNGGVVTLYFSAPRKFWDAKKNEHRWVTSWQLMDYNIDTDKVVKLYPYCKVIKGGEMPDPQHDGIYFPQEMMPPSLRKDMRDRAYYYRTKARKE